MALSLLIAHVLWPGLDVKTMHIDYSALLDGSHLHAKMSRIYWTNVLNTGNVSGYFSGNTVCK